MTPSPGCCWCGAPAAGVALGMALCEIHLGQAGYGTIKMQKYRTIAPTPDHLAYAAEVAAKLPKDPDFGDDWLDRLVESFSQFTD